MNTIHGYARSRTAPQAPGSPEKPDETEAEYSARINALLVGENFAQLEKIAQQNRMETGRLLGGVWKTYSFYEGAGSPIIVTGYTVDSAYDSQMAHITKWMAAYPLSTTARLSLAYVYLNYADVARGTGYANTVSDSDWDLYRSRYSQALAILMDASRLKEKDPAWYYAMQVVAHDGGWNKADARSLFEQAIAFEPDYYHFYREYANYLMPQWYGEPGDIPALAEEASRRSSGPTASMLYFYTVAGLACYCQEALQELQRVSFPKVKEGYGNIARLYGTSNLNANRFALIATIFKDEASAREAFTLVSQMEPEVWNSEQFFNEARGWAGVP